MPSTNMPAALAAFEPVGLVGCGLLGSAIAGRIIRTGLTVVGYDSRETRRAALRSAGGALVESVADVFRSCQSVILSLPTSTIVHEVLRDADPHIREHSTIVDTTTGSPTEVDALSLRLKDKERGIRYLDATVAGSSRQLAEGDAVLLVGAEASDFARSEPLLRLLTPHLFHIGPVGMGTRMKLVVNLAIGLHRAVLAEALGLAQAYDLDLEQTLEVLRNTPARSAVMDSKGQKMVQGDFSPQARLAQHLKDVHLMLESARAAGVSLPLTEQHRRLLEMVVQQGFADADNSAIVRAYIQDRDIEK